MANHFLMFRKRKKESHKTTDFSKDKPVPPRRPFSQMTHQEVVREMTWLMDRLGVPRSDKPQVLQLHRRAA